MIITNTTENLPGVALKTYQDLREKYGVTARPTRLLEMLKNALGLKEWTLLDERLMMNGSFDAYILDQSYQFMHGGSIDTRDILDAILTAGDFVQSEKRLLGSSDIDEIIWAIFLTITNNYK